MIARLAAVLTLLFVSTPAIASNAAFAAIQEAVERQRKHEQMAAFFGAAIPIAILIILIALAVLAWRRGKRWSLSRVWALRLVIVSAGLLICLLTLREALAEALPGPLSEAILYDGWGVVFLAVAALTGVYRLMLDRVA